MNWERGAAFVLASAGAGAAFMATDIGIGTFSAPGPGFYPFCLSITLALTAAVTFVSLPGAAAAGASPWAGADRCRPAIALGIMAVYVFLLPRLGFYPATFLLMAAWQTVVERKSWKTALAVGAGGGTAAWVLFGRLLDIALPNGSWW